METNALPMTEAGAAKHPRQSLKTPMEDWLEVD